MQSPLVLASCSPRSVACMLIQQTRCRSLTSTMCSVPALKVGHPASKGAQSSGSSQRHHKRSHMTSRTKFGRCRRSLKCRAKRLRKCKLYSKYRYVSLETPQLGVPDLKSSTAGILLRHYVWNFEKLQEQFWNDPAVALQEAGLSPPSSPSRSTHALPPTSPRRPARVMRQPVPSPVKRNRSLPSGPFECPVCCTEYSKETTSSSSYALGCGHRFCRDCWSEYLKGKVQNEGESVRIQCMESGCDRVVREEVVDEMVTANVSKK